MIEFTDSALGRARLRLLFGALWLAATIACGDGSTAPAPSGPSGPSVFTVTKAQGDNQIRFPGTTLVQDLGIEVEGAGGAGNPGGLTVTWTVLSGGGSVTAFSSTTDSNGRAYGSMTLGAVEGENRVEVMVAGVGSVTFDATAQLKGGPIAFASSRLGGASSDWEIFVMEEDGSNAMAVTSSSGLDYRPAWSPDGSKIAFTRLTGNQQDVFVINADATDEMQLTFDGNSVHPTWSPDGSKIAFSSGVPDDYDIWVMNADGSGRVKLTDNIVDFDPAWSPDGSKIAFVRFTNPGVWENDVWVMNADGTGATQLVTDRAINWLPSWSPDGSKIAYQVGGVQEGAETWIVNSDGTSPHRLTSGLPGSWSPDGRYVLVFHLGVGRDQLWDVFRVEVETGERVNLTSHPALDNWPVWRRQ